MLNTVFDRVYVINLSRREERWNEFFQRIPKNWPFHFPERYKAIDGALATPPDWWKEGNGAWGCYKTHVRIMEDCLNNDFSSVLILEDDAVFVEDFQEKAKLFLDHLPDDWEMIYLGGQHIQENIRLPRKVNEWVFRPYNVNRCHCYGFRNRFAIEKAYRHLHDYSGWNVPHHVDHYLGELHKRMESGLYSPREWLVGQAAGQSDICNSDLKERIYPGSQELVYPPVTKKGIAILGDHFGGTNTLAGLLFHLGIPLGVDMQLDEREEVPQYFEDRSLGQICRQSFEEPWLVEKLVAEDRCNHLRRWAAWQCRQEPEGGYFCGKHPVLSLMGGELLDAWNNPYFLVVDRPVEQSFGVLDRQNWGWHPSAVRYAISHLQRSREEFLVEYAPKHLRLSFEEISHDPETTVRKICDFLGYHPTAKRKQDTFRFLQAAKDDVSFGYLDRPVVETDEENKTCRCGSACPCKKGVKT